MIRSVLRRTVRRRSPALLGAASLAGLALATPLAAHEFAVGDLELLHPSAPPTPPGASSATGYLVIVNAGDEDDRLVEVRAPFAARVEMHRTTVEDDVARMRPVDGGLAVPAGATVRLEPSGTHLMFIEPDEPLAEGERRAATLVFERAGDVDVEFAIERPSAAVDHGETDHGAMDHGAMDHGDMDHGDMDHGTTDHE